MLQAMLAGVASIKAQQTRMNVIGNNLANINTTAYKSSRMTFQDMIAQTTRGASRPTSNLGGTNPIQFGLGVIVAGTDTDNGQGSLNATNRPTDFAIQGSGFLMVSDSTGIKYTRDGAFDLDATGDLVQRSTGQRLIGWTADPVTGAIDSNQALTPASKLNIPIGARTAVQRTTSVSWAGNLDARSFANATADQTQSIVTIIDTLGNPHDMTLTLVESASGNPNEWDWSVAGANGTTMTGSGTLVFDPTTGALSSGATGTVTVTPAATTGVPAFDVDLDFGSMGQLALDMQVQSSNQNGFAPGSLSSFTIGADGIITGLYTNGLTRTLGMIGMAIFPNAGGLERIGSNLWRNSENSGIPAIGSPRSGGRGTLTSGFLEQSNVDIGSEFTDLIVTQRGFQSNTKIVTTVDEMLQDLINMKR